MEAKLHLYGPKSLSYWLCILCMGIISYQHQYQFAARIRAASTGGAWSSFPPFKRSLSAWRACSSASLFRRWPTYEAYRRVARVINAMKRMPDTDRRIRIHLSDSMSDLASLFSRTLIFRFICWI